MAKEDIFYVIVHISATVYALYQFYRFGETHDLQTNGRYTEIGWSILNRRQMKYDLEIGPFISYISKSYYMLIGHCISFEVVRCLYPKKLPLMHAILGISSMCLNASAIIIAFIFMSTLSFYLVMRMGKKSFVWYTSIVWLCSRGIPKAYKTVSSLVGHDLFQFYHGFTMFSCQLLRLTSFALDYCDTNANSNRNVNKIDAKKNSHEISQRFSLEKFLGYTFYLPVFVEGPPFNYSHYTDVEIIKFKPFMVRMQQLIFGFFRLFAIYLVNELMLNHFYAGSVIFDHSHIFESLSGWALFGFIICTGLHFTNAYMLKYGLGTVLANFDGINAPNKPLCFLRIHKYSIMWRTFDPGLYEFLHKYIYIEILQQKKSPKGRKFARFSVFAFVFLWHCPGNQISMVIWVWSNFLVLFLEDFTAMFKKSQIYRAIASFIGTKTVNKLSQLLGSQLLLLSTLLSMFYLSNEAVAAHILKEIYLVNTCNNLSALLIISLVFYCIYRSCEFMFKLKKSNNAEKKFD